MTPTAPLELPLPWITLRDAWKNSPWSGKTLLEFAKKGTLKAEQRGDDEWHFEPHGFYHAMREELALEGWLALREVAVHHDVPYEALLELVEAHTLYALYTDVDWYLEPEDIKRVPELVEHCWSGTPSVQDQPVQTELNLSAREPDPPEPDISPVMSPHDWIVFRDAIHQSAFTHAELHHAVRTDQVTHRRNAQGRLLIHKQSMKALLPPSTWRPLERTALSSRDRRQALRLLESGKLEGRLMGGVWYLHPDALSRG